jgi:hypothetical protein
VEYRSEIEGSGGAEESVLRNIGNSALAWSFRIRLGSVSKKHLYLQNRSRSVGIRYRNLNAHMLQLNVNPLGMT